MRQSQYETQAGFAAGTSVRVKIGVMDPDFPGMHLGGWEGTVAKVQKEELSSYLIQWNPGTLTSVPPAIRDHCEKADIVFDKMWLFEEDLETECGLECRSQIMASMA